jgi:hypothetical protein
MSGFETILKLSGEKMPMNFAMVAHVRAPLILEQVQSACKKIQEKHPLLTVHVMEDPGGNLWFDSEGTGNIPVKIFPMGREITWKSILRRELLVPFKLGKEPLVRLLWLRADAESYLILISHHLLLDGLSCAHAMNDLIYFIAYPEKKVTPFTELPPLGDILSDTVKKKAQVFLASCRDGETVEEAITYPDVEEESYPGTYDYEILHWVLSEKETHALVAKTKRKGTSVHAAIGTAFLKAFYEVLGPKDKPVRTFQFPMNIRPFLKKQTDRHMGLYISIVLIPVDCSPHITFWECARKVKTDYQEKIEKGEPFIFFIFLKDFLKDAVNNVEKIKTLPKWAPEYEFSLSNIGRLEFPGEYGSVILEELYGPVFSAVNGEKVIAVNTFNGRMFFTFIFDRSLFPTEKAKTIMKRGIGMLKQAAEGEI